MRLSSIGDIILTSPFLRSVRNNFPHARIYYIIKKEFEELVSSSPYIDELITFDKEEGFTALRRIKQYLRNEYIDLYFDIHKNWRSRYLRYSIRPKRIETYHKKIFKRTLLICFGINLYRHIKPVYLRYFEAGNKFGLEYDNAGTEVFVKQAIHEKIRNIINNAGMKPGQPLIIICPGAAHYNKQWLPERFAETAQSLISRTSAFIIVHGGKKDVQVCNQVKQFIGDKAVSLAGILSLSESTALLQQASVVIANDSGLLHMAQSQKVPVVGIYGPTTRHLGYFPIENNSTVIETNVPCRPCTHNGLEKCPKKHFKCMKDITAEQVIEASLQYLPKRI